MAAANTKTSLDTMFKYKVAKQVENLVPSCGIMQKKIPKLASAERTGRKFLWPVALTHENGVTYGDDTSFSYESSIAGVYDEIEIDSVPVVLRSQVALSAANRMSKKTDSFITHMSLRSGNMKESLAKRAEIEILHGKLGLGVIGSNVNTNSTTEVITFSNATWAPGIWGGMENSLLEQRNSSGTKINTNADLVLASVDVDNKAITVTGHATDITAVAAADSIFFKGSYANSMNGIGKQLANSGSLFGINAATYDLWKANTHAVGGNLTMSEVLKGLAKAVGKGGLQEDTCLLISSLTFEGLNSDLAALKSFDSSYDKDKAEIGVKSIKYYFQGGVLEILPHPFMKEGEAWAFPAKGIKRIGATDITFGFGDGEYFERLEATAAYQIICQYDYCVLIVCPAKCVRYTGITNT